MGYPIFGKIKNIVLPLPIYEFNDMSIEEYKEFSGIDLRDIFELDHVNKRIRFKQTNALYYFNAIDYNLFNNMGLLPINPVNSHEIFYEYWNDVNETNAILQYSILDTDGNGLSIQFQISYRSDFDINNIKISMNQM